jgi:predicted esterase YcpF (UPF0227 family)
MIFIKSGFYKIDFKIRLYILVIMSTYTNAFLAALFSIPKVVENPNNEQPSSSMSRYIDSKTTKYTNNAMRRKFNCQHLRKTHTIGQPQWRGYSH